MLIRLVTLLLGAVLIVAPAAAQGGKRLALVVGNAGYNAQVGRLDNPGRDADLIAGALRARGFAVTLVKDAGRVALQQAVDRYATTLGQAGPGAIGFFYYSGHGVANPNNGRNYVVPVDAPSASDDSLWYNSVELQQLVRTITTTAAEATNIVVFDACREVLALPKGKNLGAGYKGLERVAGVPSTLIAFSTAPGALAADRDRTAVTGPYATELAAALRASDADVRAMFDSVKFGVLERTGNKQVPWVEDGLLRRVYLNSGTPAVPAQTATFAAPAGGKIDPGKWGLTDDDLLRLDTGELADKAQVKYRMVSIREAAGQGDPIAQVLASDAAARDNDPKSSLAFAQQAATSGLPIAVASLAGYYVYDTADVRADLPKAISLYTKSYEAGYKGSAFRLGTLYHINSRPKDLRRAAFWYRKAIENGEDPAMNNLANILNDEASGLTDHAEAALLLRRAADMGNSSAMNNLGKMYRDGQGMAKDREQALYWIRKAKAAGNPFSDKLLEPMGAR